MIPLGLLEIDHDIQAVVWPPLDRSEHGLTVIIRCIPPECAITRYIREWNIGCATVIGIGIDEVLKLIIAQVGVAPVFITSTGSIEWLRRGIE